MKIHNGAHTVLMHTGFVLDYVRADLFGVCALVILLNTLERLKKEIK